MIREIFKDAESERSGQSHVTSQPALLTPFRDPGGMLSRSVGMPSRNDKPPDIWDTHGISGNVFVNPTASSSSPYPRRFNPSKLLTQAQVLLAGIHSNTSTNQAANLHVPGQRRSWQTQARTSEPPATPKQNPRLLATPIALAKPENDEESHCHKLVRTRRERNA